MNKKNRNNKVPFVPSADLLSVEPALTLSLLPPGLCS